MHEIACYALESYTWTLEVIFDFQALYFLLKAIGSQMKKITITGVKDNMKKNVVTRVVTVLNGVWSSVQSDPPTVRQRMFSLRSSP